MKYSIIIPTYNKFEKTLKPCIESILRYTQLYETEVIVVANGCVDGTVNYIQQVKYSIPNIRLIEFTEPLGYTKAVNEGIKVARGEYYILLNNDTVILESPTNYWINVLHEPFKNDPSVGISGPMKVPSPQAGREFLIFFCVMISKKLVDEIGLLDEVFSPGYGEDTDYCCKAEDAGFKVVQVPEKSDLYYAHNRMAGNFPIFHEGNVTFKNWPDGDKLLAKNNQILYERYHPDRHKLLDVNILQAKSCDGFMSDEELVYLARLAKKSKIIIEVGSWHGKSSRAIADNMPSDAKLYCVDHWLGSEVERSSNHQSAGWDDGDHAFLEFYDNLSEYIRDGRVVPLRMHSKNAARCLNKHGVKADMIFIDAGHTYEEVKQDIELWQPLLAPNSIMCGHDYNHKDGMWEGVGRAVEEKFDLIVQPTGTNIWVHIEPGDEYKPKVYDCFPFFNELDILDVRFDELFDVVDRFVIVEATLTHGGQPKPLYFKDNLHRYEKYLSKVTHIVVDEFPALDSWSIERHQRDSGMRGLQDCDDRDIIIIGDADEIPSKSSISKFKEGLKIMALEQDLYYYFLNCKADQKWDWCKICTYDYLKTWTPCGVRYTPFVENGKRKDDAIIYDAGWHFSYIGGLDMIISKIEASAHQEYNLPQYKDRERVKELVLQGRDIFGRDLTYSFINPNEGVYPNHIVNNIESLKEKGLFLLRN